MISPAEQRFEIPAPPDRENGAMRDSLGYSVHLPRAGIGPDTGVIVFIDGFGAANRQEYITLLKRHLSARHNCAILTVDYFGLRLKRDSTPEPFPDFFQMLKEKHGIEIAPPPVDLPSHEILYRVLMLLPQQGITRLDPACRVMRRYNGEYESMGFLPALDHLAALGDLLKRYSFNTRRLYALGSSYGAYVAMLMAKLAPNSFRMVVENSGFTGPDVATAYAHAPMVAHFGDLRLDSYFPDNWSSNPEAPRYFGESNRQIRLLDHPDHLRPGETHFFLFHGADDARIPATDKQALAERLSTFNPVTLKIVEQADVDGKLFKHTEHAMNASFGDLFDLCMANYLDKAPAPPVETDFSLGHELSFPAGDKTYVLDYGAAGAPELQITETASSELAAD